jgi:hypothetical protein
MLNQADTREYCRQHNLPTAGVAYVDTMVSSDPARVVANSRSRMRLRDLILQATIRSFLMMPEKAKSTCIDRLYSLFRLHRRPVSGSRFEQFEVEFTGDVDELRREHFLTLVPADGEVDTLQSYQE